MAVSSGTSYVHTDPVVAGRTYNVKYRATNIHGVGEFSDPVAIFAAAKPD